MPPKPLAVTESHKVRRREFIACLGGAFTAPLLSAQSLSAQARKTYRIGVLETIPLERNQANFRALRRGLQERGYIEGRNLRFEYRSVDGRGDRFPALANELVGLGVDLIVTRGTPAARAAKAATSTVPIVMAAIGEPLEVGVVASLAQPGGNITGMTSFVGELSGKRVELLKEAFPGIARVASLQNMSNPIAPAQWDATRFSARTLGLSAELLDVRTADDVPRAFAAFIERRIDALAVGLDALIQAQAGAVIELAARHRVRAAFPSREFVEGGGLMSYGVNYPDLYFRSAGLIDKIFKGAKPADLPVEQPSKLELLINLKTARALGLTIPSTLIARADEVVE
jgi:putative ABC transport system substrate-binding protein